MKKINVITLGCSKNTVDSEHLMAQLEAAGYTVAADSDRTDAKVVVINTCGFIGDAKQESIDMILRAAAAKQAGRIERLFVVGCLSERYADELRAELPEVDEFFGVKDWAGIARALGAEHRAELETERRLTTPAHYAYLKIGEGCNWKCGYCAIPLIRGPHVSVPMEVLEEEARKLDGIQFLGQGTIYPDIIESGTKTVKAVKSHHNVGGLPENLDFELVEPLKMLFKDEVRACGKALGLPDSMVYRQPFPGPGLGVRCLGAITRDRLEAVRESDAILREEFAKNGLEGKVWQYFTAIPDLKSVGVRDNRRTDEWCVIIRAVNTVDAMTATVENVPFDLLQHITARITNEVKGVNRVLFDLTPKPSGTIEWE